VDVFTDALLVFSQVSNAATLSIGYMFFFIFLCLKLTWLTSLDKS